MYEFQTGSKCFIWVGSGEAQGDKTPVDPTPMQWRKFTRLKTPTGHSRTRRMLCCGRRKVSMRHISSKQSLYCMIVHVDLFTENSTFFVFLKQYTFENNMLDESKFRSNYRIHLRVATYALRKNNQTCFFCFSIASKLSDIKRTHPNLFSNSIQI